MMFELGQQIERLQAVNAQSLKKIVVWSKLLRPTLKCAAARFSISSSVWSADAWPLVYIEKI